MKLFNKGINLFVMHEDAISDDTINQIHNNFNIGTVKEIEKYLQNNKVLPYGAHVLNKVSKGDAIQYWSGIHLKFENRNIKILTETKKLFKQFSDFNIQTVTLFENFGTILLTDACLGCFSSGDIDFTADYSEKQKIESALHELGYINNLRRNVPEYIMSTFGTENVLEGDFFWINIEWRPIARRYIRKIDLLERRLGEFRTRNSQILENGIRVLSADALLYFNLLHVSVGHYFNTSPGIRLYADIDRLVRSNQKINIQTIFSWAKEDGQVVRVFTALKIASDILDTPINVNDLKISKREMKYSNKIVKYLWSRKTNSYVIRDSIVSQIILDSYAEGINLFRYLIERFIKLNRS